MSIVSNALHAIKLAGFRASRADFYVRLADSYQLKEALRDFLEEEHKIARGKDTADSSVAYALTLIRARFSQGQSSGLLGLLSGIVPDEDRVLLAAIDDSPKKDEMLRVLAGSITRANELKSMAKKRLIAPGFLLLIVLAMAYVNATMTLPVIIKAAPESVWNGFNSTYRAVNQFLAEFGILGAAGGVVMFGLFVRSLSRWTGAWRARFESVSPTRALLLFPVAPWILPLAVYRDIQVALMLISLSVILRSGASLKDALDTLQANGTPWMRWQIGKVMRHLAANETDVKGAFSKGLLSPSMLARLSSMARTNPRFDEVLIHLGQQGNAKVQEEAEVHLGRVATMVLVFAAMSMAYFQGGSQYLNTKMTSEMSPSKMLARQASGLHR